MSYYIWVERVCFVNGVYPSFFSFEERNIKPKKKKRKIDEKMELKGRSPKQLTDLWFICSTSVFGKTFYCYQNCRALLLLSVEYGFTRPLVDHWKLSAIALTTGWVSCGRNVTKLCQVHFEPIYSAFSPSVGENPRLYESIIRSLLWDRA